MQQNAVHALRCSGFLVFRQAFPSPKDPSLSWACVASLGCGKNSSPSIMRVAAHSALRRSPSIWDNRSQPLRLVSECFAGCITRWLCSACLLLGTSPSTTSSFCSCHRFSRHIYHCAPTPPSSWHSAPYFSSLMKLICGGPLTSFCLRSAHCLPLHEHHRDNQCASHACKCYHKQCYRCPKFALELKIFAALYEV